MSIIIIPYGEIGAKLAALTGAIDLQKRTNKKIEIWYSKQYYDLFFDGSTFAFEDLPEFKFKNISYKLKDYNVNDSHGLHLQRLLKWKELLDHIDKYSEDNNLPRYNYGVIDNKYPIIDSGIIEKTWINSYNNLGFDDVKLWLSDITKYKVYDTFMKYVGFDWINPECELVHINIPITLHFESIYYELSNHHILSPNYYKDALDFIKSKSKKPLQIYIRSDVDKIYLSDYINVISKYGSIICLDREKENFYRQSYIIIMLSKVSYIIDAASYLSIFSSIFSNIKYIISTNFNLMNKNNYNKNVVFLDYNKYKIETTRKLNNLNIRFTLGYKPMHLNNEYESVYYQFESMKSHIFKNYNKFYEKFEKYIKSKYLKELLLYKVLFLRNKVRKVHSNISVNEGLKIFELIKKYKPKKLIEIGLACGISTGYMLSAINPGDKLYSVDPFQKIEWDRFGLINANYIVNELELPKNTHHWIPLFSENYFDKTNDKYDFMLIDGDHSYEGTMIDLMGSLKILNKGGILAVDDVLHEEVGKAAKSFFKKYRSNFEEITTNVNTMGFYIKK